MRYLAVDLDEALAIKLSLLQKRRRIHENIEWCQTQMQEQLPPTLASAIRKSLFESTDLLAMLDATIVKVDTGIAAEVATTAPLRAV